MLPRLTRSATTLIAALALTACSGRDLIAPIAAPAAPRLDVSAATVPTVHLSEIHYDNVGTDADEKIESTGPAGTDVTGWQLVLYNGNGGAS